MATYGAADIYVVERDLSQEIEATSTSVGAVLVYSDKGEIGKPILVTSIQDYLDRFGTPKPSNGYGGYAAIAFLNSSNQLYVSRVVAGAYANAGLKVGVVAGLPTGTGEGAKDPEGIAMGIGDAFYIYRRGPGTEGNNFSVSITSQNMVVPTGLTATPSATGGTLAAGSQSYRVAAFNALGSTALSTPVVAVTTGTTGSSALEFNRVEGAAGYKLFGRAGAGSDRLLAIISQADTAKITYVDTGAPAYDSLVLASGLVAYTPTIDFTVNVFDSTQSLTQPVESWLCSVEASIDGFGQQQKIDEKINVFSRYIKVFSNDLYTGSVKLQSMAKTALTGGLNGSVYSGAGTLISDSAWINTLDQYMDKESVTVRLLIEGGRGSPAVQLKMDSVAKKRGDCIAILDMPSYAQEASRAVDYRNLTLNLNSNRSTIYTPDVLIQDPYNDLVMHVPPSGYVASVYAYTDAVTNAWWAPAGLNRGLLNVLGVRYKYDSGQRDTLSNARINYMRNFPGLGIAVWECWTLQSKLSAFSFVNVRRLFDLVGVSVARALLFSEFDPNDDFMKRQVVNLIAQFLDTIQSARGINDYKVVCDSSNNTGSDAAKGQLNIDVYIQPTLPVRVIQLKLIATKQGVAVSEFIGQAA